VGHSQNREDDRKFWVVIEYGKGKLLDRLVFEGPGISNYPGQPDGDGDPDLESIPEAVDVVQVFRKSEDVPPVVDSAIKIGAKVVWMQEGISNESAAQKAREAGLKVVMNACMRATHRRLLGMKPMGL
jgi:hypothetical protein